MAFAFLRSITCVNTIAHLMFLRATFTSVCNKHVLVHLKLFKKFSLSSKPLRMADKWTPSWFAGLCFRQLQSSDESVSVQCNSRDCERFASLHHATVVVFISMIFLHSACKCLRW